jgi:hypothetical protein
MTSLQRAIRTTTLGAAAVTMALAIGMTTPRESQALTFVLDFDNTGTDIFSQTTGPLQQGSFNFFGLSEAQVEQATLSAVTSHYQNYVTIGADPLSPLANGQQLDIDFEIGAAGTSPLNGDSDFWSIKIGDGISGTGATNPGIFGAACGACVRTGAGVSNQFNLTVGATVGSIWTDHIDNFAALATSASELINLIAGTISHEIGHTLALGHTSPNNAMAPNPGASAWGIMGSGATAMPTAQRVLGREFTYDNFGVLINAVGTRRVAVAPSVSEPGQLALISIGLVLLVSSRRRRNRRSA